VVFVLGRLSHWSPWLAESHNKREKNLKKKKYEKKLIHCLPVPVVPVVGRLSH
jgi:hypothetical protein